ncbi:MAG: hypothetical protein C0390_00040 [Syntrophus sp. (in: bacteria)]|nr:hypothetical protein [Syntrophus sp. (in: bacteria)]
METSSITSTDNISDMRIIEQIGVQIGVPFPELNLDELETYPDRPKRGYFFSESGNIVTLWLNNTCFSEGRLLGDLQEIETLIIRFNDIRDFVFLNRLHKLKILSISAPYLTDFSFLKELKGLTSLYLSFNNLTDVSFLKELKGLTSLDLSGNKLTDFSFLKELKGLTSLDLSGNNLTDVSFLKELKGLTSLDLSGNKLTDFSFLKELKGLTSRYLSGNKLTDFSFLKELKGLTSLDLSRNKLKDVSFLKELKGLTFLDLSRNNLTDVSFLKELKGLTSLDLSFNNLKDVSFLKELKGLTSLDLSFNNLKDVSFLKELKGLTALYLSFYNLTDVSFLKELKGLTFLDLSFYNLTDVSFLKELKGLTALCLNFNKLTDVSFLKELKGLTFLYLSGNNLTDVSFLKELKGLTSLYLSGNKLTDVSFLKELKGLTALDLSGNNLTDFSFLKELKGLTALDLSGNKLTSLAIILSLLNLRHLLLEKTTVSDLPKSYVVQLANIEDIRSFYRQKAKKKDKLYEAKVLFVGEPKAGKTSLMKRLVDDTYRIDPSREEDSTLGINVYMNWLFDFEYTAEGKKSFKAHLWDFGGQQIQYYIHQFFLTEDALYVLMLDDRKDCPNIDYWFRIIHLLGKDSPVLVVRNRKNIESSTGFDWNLYKNRYGNDLRVLEYEDINLFKEDYRFAGIASQIKKLLTGLKHVGEELPASWIRVREAVIEQQRKNHITMADFKEICKKQEITEEADQLAVCNFLNTLGIILHFRNDTALADTLFVNPQWISKAVYMILSDKDIEKTHGRFEKTLLFDKWSDQYSFEEKNKLLNLMQKKEFDLVYRVEGGKGKADTFIAPLLLSDVAPVEANNWDKKGTLSFQYRYKFMPEGIITRLIVRLNDWIAKNPDKEDLVWKSGIILCKDGCKALVKKDLSKEGLKLIDISVRGNRLPVKDFLALIRGTIDAVHIQSFPRVDVEPLVPCTCPICREIPNPTMFELSRLQDYITANEFHIRCEKPPYPFRNVSIADLLGGIVEHRAYERDLDHYPDDQMNRDMMSKDQVQEILTTLLREGKFHQNQQLSIQMTLPPTPTQQKEKTTWLNSIYWIIGILVGLTGFYTFYTNFIADKPKQAIQLQNEGTTLPPLNPKPPDAAKPRPAAGPAAAKHDMPSTKR